MQVDHQLFTNVLQSNYALKADQEKLHQEVMTAAVKSGPAQTPAYTYCVLNNYGNAFNPKPTP